MNNEPVAEKTSNNGWMVSKEYMELPVGTLLYTHPAKTQADIEYEADKAYWRTRTLTDDEIAKLFHETFNLQYTLLEDGLKFARAILRKAQEK
jgi:hypothetical protein